MDDPGTRNLTMHPDIGIVWRRCGEDLEYRGFIGDPDNCPEGLEAEWRSLLDRWEDSGRATRGCIAAVGAAYYDRLSIQRMN
jgi:hypothetical protein